jgi:hypothetical protein
VAALPRGWRVILAEEVRSPGEVLRAPGPARPGPARPDTAQSARCLRASVRATLTGPVWSLPEKKTLLESRKVQLFFTLLLFFTWFVFSFCQQPNFLLDSVEPLASSFLHPFFIFLSRFYVFRFYSLWTLLIDAGQFNTCMRLAQFPRQLKETWGSMMYICVFFFHATRWGAVRFELNRCCLACSGSAIVSVFPTTTWWTAKVTSSDHYH